MNEWLEKMKVWQKGFAGSVGKTNLFSSRVVWLGAIGVLLLAFGAVYDPPEAKDPAADRPGSKTETAGPEKTGFYSAPSGEEALMEEKLAALLSNVKGAGKVMVSVTLEGSARQEHEKNTTRETKVVEEKDTAGGVRTTKESKESAQVLMSKEGAADRPVMVSRTRPEIKGVLIVAEGAADSSVKADLTRAAETGLGIASHKITVLPQGKRGS